MPWVAPSRSTARWRFPSRSPMFDPSPTYAVTLTSPPHGWPPPTRRPPPPTPRRGACGRRPAPEPPGPARPRRRPPDPPASPAGRRAQLPRPHGRSGPTRGSRPSRPTGRRRRQRSLRDRRRTPAADRSRLGWPRVVLGPGCRGGSARRRAASRRVPRRSGRGDLAEVPGGGPLGIQAEEHAAPPPVERRRVPPEVLGAERLPDLGQPWVARGIPDRAGHHHPPHVVVGRAVIHRRRGSVLPPQVPTGRVPARCVPVQHAVHPHAPHRHPVSP